MVARRTAVNGFAPIPGLQPDHVAPRPCCAPSRSPRSKTTGAKYANTVSSADRRKPSCFSRNFTWLYSAASNESPSKLMLLRRDVADAIAAGQIDMQFRLWRKPTVKAGGRLRTVVGELTILSVEEINLSDPKSVTADDARRAGFASAEEVRLSLVPRTAGSSAKKPAAARARTAKPDETSRPYRVTLRFGGVDSRMALREDVSPTAIAAVIDQLDAMDRRSTRGPWTRRTLRLIAASRTPRPGVGGDGKPGHRGVQKRCSSAQGSRPHHQLGGRIRTLSPW